MLTPILEGLTTLASGILGYQGQKQTNTANAQQAQKQMDFQERMSNTSYQRAVEDMRKAGLNPALAYQQGGAATPSGASTVLGNPIAAGTNSAGAAATTFANVQATMAQAQRTQAETRQIKIESLQRLKQLEESVRLTTASANESRMRFNVLNQNWTSERIRNNFMEQLKALEVDQARADINNTTTNARERAANARLLELDTARARNVNATQSTWFKKYVSPYLNDASSAIRTINSVRPR